jgi:hypothetical protein
MNIISKQFIAITLHIPSRSISLQITDPCYILWPILQIGYNMIIESFLLIFIVTIVINVSHFKHIDSMTINEQNIVESSN